MCFIFGARDIQRKLEKEDRRDGSTRERKEKEHEMQRQRERKSYDYGHGWGCGFAI